MNTSQDIFLWLQSWYADQTNGDWEHQYGIEINTLDNPGWMVKIDLTDTPLSDKAFNETEIRRAINDWIVCKKEGGQFRAYCGPLNLHEALKVFRRWVEATA